MEGVPVKEYSGKRSVQIGEVSASSLRGKRPQFTWYTIKRRTETALTYLDNNSCATPDDDLIKLETRRRYNKATLTGRLSEGGQTDNWQTTHLGSDYPSKIDTTPATPPYYNPTPYQNRDTHASLPPDPPQNRA